MVQPTAMQSMPHVEKRVVLFWALADHHGRVRNRRRTAGRRAAGAHAIRRFRSLAYGESLDLALALAAWYAARHQHWRWAAAAASGAALVRVNGVFVALALAVMWVVARREGRAARRSSAFTLLLPFASAGAYLWYVQSRSWPSWMQAQGSAWDRNVGWPWRLPGAGDG
jgi:hypothetical protein